MREYKPVARFRAGRVTCALFDQEDWDKPARPTVLRAVVARRYRDQWGFWKSEFSFEERDLLPVVYVLKRAFTYMVDHDIEMEITRAIEEAASMPLPRSAKRPAA
jgi:hypothetical protein